MSKRDIMCETPYQRVKGNTESLTTKEEVRNYQFSIREEEPEQGGE